jgi:hypothetical protein
MWNYEISRDGTAVAPAFTQSPWGAPKAMTLPQIFASQAALIRNLEHEVNPHSEDFRYWKLRLQDLDAEMAFRLDTPCYPYGVPA